MSGSLVIWPLMDLAEAPCRYVVSSHSLALSRDDWPTTSLESAQTTTSFTSLTAIVLLVASL